MSTKQRYDECSQLVDNPAPLVDEFLDAVRKMQGYDNRNEGFYPSTGRVASKDRNRDAGTVVVTDRLASGRVSVPKLAPYEFELRHCEVNPLRTTRGKRSDGTPATRSGAGGVDYVALLAGRPSTPILGEIKVGGDKDTYYAYVQLLTHLSEFSSAAQLIRATEYLFEGSLVDTTSFDLHLLLVDYNARGADKSHLIQSTHSLAIAFKAGLTAAGLGSKHMLGRTLCLATTLEALPGPLDLVWSA